MTTDQEAFKEAFLNSISKSYPEDVVADVKKIMQGLNPQAKQVNFPAILVIAVRKSAALKAFARRTAADARQPIC